MPLYENIGSAVLIIRLIGIMEICWSYIVNEVKAKKKKSLLLCTTGIQDSHVERLSLNKLLVRSVHV